MSRRKNDINKVTSTIMGISSRVLIYVLVFFLMYMGITRGYSYGHEIFAPAPMAEAPGIDHEFVIAEGESVKTVAKRMEDEGLIKDSLVVEIQAKIYEYTLHPGTYTLNTSATSKDMLKLIDEGNKKSEDGKS